jgi:hypothetical protein
VNAMEWLKSVRDQPQKSPIPPVPPEGGLRKTSGNIGIPPVPPRNSNHFLENENKVSGTQPETKEMYWGEETEVGSSGGDGGNQGFCGGNEGLLHKGDRGNWAKAAFSEAVPSLVKSLPLPFITADGTLSIPFDSDPKYHWWRSGQSVAQTRAEVLAWREAKGW